MPLNPTSRDILDAILAGNATAHDDAVLAQAALDEMVAVANNTFLQAELTASYTGDIRNDMIGIHEKIDIEIGLQTEIRDLLTAFKFAFDAFTAVQDANHTEVMNDLELLINNGAANTLALIAATCGDCPPPVDPGEDFACWEYQNTSTGPDGEQGLPFNSGPGFGPFNAGEGYSIHWNGNEYLEDTRIYIHQVVPDDASILLATMDSVGDSYSAVWNGDPITVSASEWPEFPKNLFSVWICPDGVEPPE